MKREDITKIIPDISKENLDAIMTLHGQDIEGHKSTITALTTERDGLQTQLTAANTEIKSYKDMDVDGIKTKASEWEGKYNTDTQALKDQLEAVKYGHGVEAAAAGLKFTSESARKAFIADLTAKKLTLQDGKLLGMDDFVKAYQTSDPGAFAPEGGAPHVVTQTGGAPGAAGAAGAAFTFGFTGVRAKPNDNK